jgi:hypothetical protein
MDLLEAITWAMAIMRLSPLLKGIRATLSLRNARMHDGIAIVSFVVVRTMLAVENCRGRRQFGEGLAHAGELAAVFASASVPRPRARIGCMSRIKDGSDVRFYSIRRLGSRAPRYPGRRGISRRGAGACEWGDAWRSDTNSHDGLSVRARGTAR